MKIGVISGSNRSRSESARIAQWFMQHLSSLGHHAEMVDASKEKISYEPEVLWANDDPVFTAIRDRLQPLDGYVVVAPEWGGAASPVIMNLFLHLGAQVFADKPVYVVGVSSTRGGQRPVTQLRSYAYKNSYAVFLPEWLVVQECETAFQSEDEYVVQRAIYGVEHLLAYAEALQPVRTKNLRDYERFQYGM